MKTAILFFATLFSVIAYGQSGNVSINIRNEQQQALENATAELLRASDSSLVRTALSDPSGVASFENIPAGSYIIRTSVTGFSVAYSNAFSVNSAGVVAVPAVTLTAKVQQMTEVTVTAKKPFIQKLNDRIVVNVDNSIVNAGSTALEVLERSPGITIDQNDAISLRGRSGVIIMIDGKPSPMSGADLANYLRGLPSNAIERIDIITNPSARYDAAGNSGIIDIRMKKDQRHGTNGTVTAGYGQGIYPKANAGITFNHRNKVMNAFGNYNYSYRKFLNHLVLDRNFYNQGVFIGGDDKDNYAVMPTRFHSARAGMDFFPSKKTILGFVVNSSFNHLERRSDNNTTINDLHDQPESRFTTLATNNDRNHNVVANVNAKHTFAPGKEISADVDFGTFRSRSLTRTASSFFELSGSPKGDDEILDGDQHGKLNLRTAKVDYVNPVHKTGKVETGFKTSYVSADNDARFYNVFSTGTVVDATKTNRFFYEEYNNAGYLNYSNELKKFSYQVGLRAEQTRIRTRQEKGNKQFSNDYVKLFPSAFLNYKLKENHTLGASVSRRIDRPGYAQLNPFLFQIDATVYNTGEPHLRAQMTWSYELSYTLTNLSFTLGYSHTTDPQTIVISRILDVIPGFEIRPGQDSNITVQIPVNLESSDYYGLTATLPVRVKKWWNMVNNVNAYYNHFNGNLGGSVLNAGRPAISVRTNNTFTFPKGWSAELNANLNSGGQYGYMVSEPQWGVAVGAQKNVLKNNGTIRFNVTDIFWTNLPKATINFEGNYVENWHAKRETRVATLSFTYRFGNAKVQAARRRTTASEEERQRAGG